MLSCVPMYLRPRDKESKKFSLKLHVRLFRQRFRDCDAAFKIHCVCVTFLGKQKFVVKQRRKELLLYPSANNFYFYML